MRKFMRVDEDDGGLVFCYSLNISDENQSAKTAQLNYSLSKNENQGKI
jgi:hypothetical protein